MKSIYIMLMIVAGVLIVCAFALEPYAETTETKAIVVVLGSMSGLIISTVANWMYIDKKFD